MDSGRDAPSDVLIVSTFGDTVSGGGLFAVDDSRAERIDRISSMGLAFDGRRLARMFRCTVQEANVGECAVYDEHGVQRYLRLDGAASAHDVAWDGDNLVVVCTFDDAVRWFSPSGEIVREVRYPGPSDSGHVNCVVRRDDVWYGTVFGDFGTFRAWSPPSREGEGRIVDLISGRTVAGGLTSPHTPRWVDGMWLVCNSEGHELLAIDERSAQVVKRVPCGNWTRGLAFDDDFFYVGTCRRRASHEANGGSAIVVVDRGTWKPVERIEFPVQEIYDVLFVPQSLRIGLERGFDVNPLRASESRQYGILTELGIEQPRTLWPSGDPLPWTDFRCEIACELPAACTEGELLEIPLRVTNRSGSFFTSAPPAPVYASYKWLDPQTGEYVNDKRAFRSHLPRTVFPGETVELTALVVAPELAGTAIARITLMQEGVSWFDDHDRRNAVEAPIEVTPGDRHEPRTGVPIQTRSVTAVPDSKETFYRLAPGERRRLTLHAMETRTPLLVRWERVSESWHDEWGLRAAAAAQRLRARRSVADLGCGGMALERYLRPSQKYVPVDIVARDDRTIVLDLDKDELIRAPADGCALLGVMEYLFDLPAVLANVRTVYSAAVVSYNVCSGPGEVDRRLEHGWVNHFGLDELRRVFRAAGFSVAHEHVLAGSEYLFELARMS